jgi:hypothetical protein
MRGNPSAKSIIRRTLVQTPLAVEAHSWKQIFPVTSTRPLWFISISKQIQFPPSEVCISFDQSPYWCCLFNNDPWSNFKTTSPFRPDTHPSGDNSLWSSKYCVINVIAEQWAEGFIWHVPMSSLSEVIHVSCVVIILASVGIICWRICLCTSDSQRISSGPTLQGKPCTNTF